MAGSSGGSPLCTAAAAAAGPPLSLGDPGAERGAVLCFAGAALLTPTGARLARIRSAAAEPATGVAAG
eukprot:1363112-Pyramimonas_sp.AAC.1